MKLGLLFAGQGTQRAGMGKDLYEAYPAFRDILDRADSAVDFDLRALCFEGPDALLAQTQFTQPCMVAFAAGVMAVLCEAELKPSAAAGLSLGEYSALCAAGVLDAETAVALAAFRGRVMAESVKNRKTAMAAVLGLSREALRAALSAVEKTAGIVEIANYNCPGQMVIGGDAEAVEQASALALEAGARACRPLNVSGPFHTSLMAPAGAALAEKLKTVSFGTMAFPVYFNCIGGPKSEADSIPALLERQVQSGVYMEDILRCMEAEGIDTLLEIGPGKVLSGFVKKTVPALFPRCHAVETAEELSDVLSWFKEESL